MDDKTNLRRGYWSELRHYNSIVSLLLYGMLGSIILIIVDLLNYPSRFLFSGSILLGLLILIGIFIILTLVLWKLGILQMFQVTSTNSFDAFIFSIIFCSALLTVGYILMDAYYSSVPIHPYKIIGSSFIFTVSLTLFGIRIFHYINKHKKLNKLPTTIFDLKDIVNGNFNPIPGKPILVSEEAVDYDLLDRGPYIDQLYSAITTCNPDKGFVISLEGAWGSGKTTILNNVKKHLRDDNILQKQKRRKAIKKDQGINNNHMTINDITEHPNIILIDDFDPWGYGDTEGMLFGFFDAILRETGIRINMLALRHLINELSTTLSNQYPLSKVFRLSFYSASQSSRVKELVNDYLVSTNQKVIVLLDNIDRAESENIILLFKIIGNVFNLNRVIYILSFDPDRVQEIFKEKLSIDYGFVKKIIQLPVHLPPIAQENKAMLIESSLINLLKAYGEEEQNFCSYAALSQCMIQTIDDLRDWKRFINTAFTSTFLNNNGLYLPDLLAMKFIQFSCPQLYQEIRTNPNYFVSHDRMINIDLMRSSLKREKFNEESKSFFLNLFTGKLNEYQILLEELFPYVKRYASGQKVQPEYGDTEESSDISAKSRICSAKYFDLYLTMTSNDYLRMGEQVKDAITKINRANDQNTSDEIIRNLIQSTSHDQHREMMERLQSLLTKVKAQLMLAVSLLNQIKGIDYSAAFLAINAKRRSELIIAILLQRMPENDFTTFLETFKTDYAHIGMLSSIIEWLKSSSEESNKERIIPLKDMCKQMCQDVISKPINLYSDQYYIPHNIDGVIQFFIDDLPTLHKYIANVACSSNIYRIIYDTVSVSTGSKICYFISPENWNSLFTLTNVDDLITQNPPLTESEDFIFKVYVKYKENLSMQQSTHRMFEEGKLMVSNQIRLEL